MVRFQLFSPISAEDNKWYFNDYKVIKAFGKGEMLHICLGTLMLLFLLCHA